VIGTVSEDAHIEAALALGYDMVIATKSFPASLEGKKVGIVVDPVGTVGRGWGRPGGRVPTVRPVAPMLR